MPKKSANKAVSKKKIAPTQSTAPADAGYEPSKSRVLVGRAKARLPALSAVERTAFRSLATDAQRSALGARTKARGVAGDAVRWIVQIDKDGAEYPALFDFYAKERFAYFVESVEALMDQIDAEGSRRAKKDTLEGSAGSATERAKALRKRLVLRLGRFAGDREEEKGELAGALGSIATDDDLGKSIQSLAKLARAWLAREDAASKVLAKAAKLTAVLVDEMLAAGKALTGAAADAMGAGPALGKDSPEINVREGEVLREMRDAMSAVGEANEEHKTIRKLVPGAATRGVLGPKKAKVAKEEGAVGGGGEQGGVGGAAGGP